MSGYRFAHTVFTLMVVFACMVCVPVSAATTPAADGTTKLPLWRVTSAHRTLYVTGAMSISLKARPVPKRTAQAFAQSEKLVMEGPIGPKANAERKALLEKYAPLPEGKTLADELTDAQLQNVKTVLTVIGIDYNDVKHDQPWAVLLHFAQAAANKSGRKPHPRYQDFKKRAQQRHIPVDYLDTLKQEIEMMANWPSKTQVAMLMQTVHMVLHPAAAKGVLDARKAWVAGDMQSAAKNFAVHFKDYPGLYQAMVTSRHDRWTNELSAMLAKPGKPVFLVVGAPHLFGPHNLLDHLRQDGYTVTQL